MFSDVGNIHAPNNPLLREAEVTDTRLPQNNQKPVFTKNRKRTNKDRDEKGSEITLSDQSNNPIPIDVIYEFLANIVQSNPQIDKNIDNETMPSLFDTLAENKLLQIRKRYEAARAAHAYQHASHAGQNSKVHHIDTSNKNCLGLSTLPNKKLYALIKDLDTLRRHGVTNLMIRKKNSFLQSLIDCVEEEKIKIKQ